MVDLEGHNFLLHPALVRRNDTSAASIDEWTGEKLSKSDNVPDDIQPDTVAPLGNYAVQILWQDGFNQVRQNAEGVFDICVIFHTLLDLHIDYVCSLADKSLC